MGTLHLGQVDHRVPPVNIVDRSHPGLSMGKDGMFIFYPATGWRQGVCVCV